MGLSVNRQRQRHRRAATPTSSRPLCSRLVSVLFWLTDTPPDMPPSGRFQTGEHHTPSHPPVSRAAHCVACVDRDRDYYSDRRRSRSRSRSKSRSRSPERSPARGRSRSPADRSPARAARSRTASPERRADRWACSWACVSSDRVLSMCVACGAGQVLGQQTGVATARVCWHTRTA